jgi:hypothetical protein
MASSQAEWNLETRASQRPRPASPIGLDRDGRSKVCRQLPLGAHNCEVNITTLASSSDIAVNEEVQAVSEQSPFGIWPASAITPHREISKSHSYSSFGNLRRREARDENRPSPLSNERADRTVRFLSPLLP